MAEPTGLAARRVLVTGGSSGIGAQVVRAATARGDRVAALARRPEPLERLAESTGAHPVRADVTDFEAVTSAAERAEAAMGGIDAVVAAAGRLVLGPVAIPRPDDWRATMEVNALGVLHTAAACLPALRRAADDGGPADWVTLGSWSGRRVAGVDTGVYAASKHAAHAATDALRAELSGTGVRVTLIAPGFVRTDMLDDGAAPAVAERFAERMATAGLPVEAVADAVLTAVDQPAGVRHDEVFLRSTEQA